MEQIRSFIAVELPDEIKRAIGRVQEQLKSGSHAPAKWVEPGSMHLTLKFLGNIDASAVGKITGALEASLRGIAPFSLGVRGLGAFPGLNRVQIIRVGVTGEIDKIRRLQQAVESGLSLLGFTPEERAFTPHLTLARLRDQASPDERRGLGQLIAATPFEAALSLEVKAVHLIKSRLTPQGAIYSRLSSVELG